MVDGKDSIGPAIEDDVAVFIQQRGVRSRGFRRLSRDREAYRALSQRIDIDGARFSRDIK